MTEGEPFGSPIVLCPGTHRNTPSRVEDYCRLQPFSYVAGHRGGQLTIHGVSQGNSHAGCSVSAWT